MTAAIAVACLILAGGRGERLGASVPKPLVDLGGRPMLAHVLDRVADRLDTVVLGANDVQAFAGFGLPVVPDLRPDRPGPLAAIEAASAWLAHGAPATTHLLTLPGDTPFLPIDVVERMTARAGMLVALAARRNRLHPTIGIWPLPALGSLGSHLDADDDRSIRGFAVRAGFVRQDFDDDAGTLGGDPFFNVNTAADLDRARGLVAVRKPTFGF